MQCQHDDDDAGLDDEVKFRREAGNENAGVDRLDDQRADQRRCDREAPAVQRRAADDDREDRVEFEPEAGIVGIGATDIGGHDQARDGGTQARDRIDEEQQEAGLHTGKRCGTAVDAGCLDQEAERRAADQQADEKAGAEPEKDRDRNAGEGTGSER